MSLRLAQYELNPADVVVEHTITRSSLLGIFYLGYAVYLHVYSLLLYFLELTTTLPLILNS